MVKGSKTFKVNKEDLIKVAKGASIAVIGALLTYGSEYLSGVDYGEWTPLIVAVWSVFVNLGRKFIANNQ
jgi:hypothetical protein